MKIGIIGLGLIGGSIAKVLKKKIGCEIVASNRSEGSVLQAKADGIVDAYSLTDLSIFVDCRVIFLCTPVDKIPIYAKMLQPYINRECILTDVGSTKQSICNKMRELKEITFIGGHPMAGSEKTGYGSSSEDLFKGCIYVLTPQKDTPQEKLIFLEDIISKTDAKTVIMTPDIHDKAVAAISHAPHLIASALVNTAKELSAENEFIHPLAAGGFKDITRIAGSSPEVWTSICEDNKEYILEVLSKFKQNITNIENALKNGEALEDFFADARDYRNSFK